MNEVISNDAEVLDSLIDTAAYISSIYSTSQRHKEVIYYLVLATLEDAMAGFTLPSEEECANSSLLELEVAYRTPNAGESKWPGEL